MIYCFDIDGTICETVAGDYENALPFPKAVEKIKRLKSEGHRILFMTARGACSGKDWTEFTAQQLKSWGLEYDELIMNRKPHADIFIDDKALNASDWLSQ